MLLARSRPAGGANFACTIGWALKKPSKRTKVHRTQHTDRHSADPENSAQTLDPALRPSQPG